MRTNIVIDDDLMKATLKATGLRTKREAVEAGLRSLLRLSKQAELKRLRGRFPNWVGDLDAMRLDGAGDGDGDDHGGRDSGTGDHRT
jgi:Arc/MetJ family transcription regulator